MRKPIVALVLVAVLAAGCGQGVPAPSGAAPVSSPIPAVSAGAVIDPAICALEGQPPPPDQAPPPGGEGGVDLADFGNGRLRLCLASAEPIEIEGEASCLWNDSRTEVSEISGLPIGANANTRIAGSISLARSQISLDIFDGAPDEVSVYSSGDIPQAIEPGPGGTSGAARFRLAPLIDPNGSPATRPADGVGVLRWTCGQPPVPRPGRSTGRVHLRLDAPVARTWDVAARCSWVTTQIGPRLSNIETNPPDMTFEDRLLGVSVSIVGREPDGVDATLFVATDQESSFYHAREENVVRLGQAANGGSGAIRIRHMTPDAAGELPITGDVVDTPGVLRWVCPPPQVPGVEADWIDADVPETHPGIARLTFDPAVVDPVEGPITCTFDRTDPDYLLVRATRGSIRSADGGRYELRSNGSADVVAVVSADGQPAGEYAGQAARIGDQADRGPLLIDVPALDFEPADPAYVQLGGRDAPRRVRLVIDYSCELGNG